MSGLGTSGVDPRCAICKNADMKRLVEMGYNDRMTYAGIAHAFGGVPSAAQVKRHVTDHRRDGWTTRDILVEPARTTRARIEEVQRRMLDEIEMRMQWADERAAEARDNGNSNAKPSDWFDVLNPKVQAAIGSVIKMQDQTDKRDSKRANIAVDVMKLMGGAPPPSHLIEDGKTVEGEATDLGPVPEAE